jgi:hypothetical protein
LGLFVGGLGKGDLIIDEYRTEGQAHRPPNIFKIVPTVFSLRAP